MIYSIKKSLFILLGVSLFISGCANTQVAQPAPELNEDYKKVVFINKNIPNWLKIENISTYERDDGLLIVEARLTNIYNFNKKVSYKVDWFDNKGFMQKSILSKWVVAEVEQGRELVINVIAPSIKVADFRIRIQEPIRSGSYKMENRHDPFNNN